MSSVFSRPSRHISHEDEKEISYQNLANARARVPDYSSEQQRQAMVDACCDRCNGRKPYAWQLDAAEAFSLGLDCTVVAGTGAGKTLPFVLPSFVSNDKVTVVISPLNVLEEEHVSILWLPLR